MVIVRACALSNKHLPAIMLRASSERPHPSEVKQALGAARRGSLAVALAVLSLVASSGCTRAFYRTQADREVTGLVGQKAFDLHWHLPPLPVAVDPRSRYFQPGNQDCSPMPEDDPISHRYMHCVDGMKGYPCWHMCDHPTTLENPKWRALLEQYATFTDSGSLVLPLDTAVRLAVLHSPNYREQIEVIYLSALDVSTERFRFDTQFFGSISPVFNHQGEVRSPLGEQNTLTNTINLEAHRKFATGAELLVGFANSFVWQFAGTDTNATTSLINFNLVQPLLRAGGRAVALEQLTIVERGLLANLRAFQRYRQGFYTNVAVGDQSVTGPQRRGGFFGGTGLTGFTGQGSGGFGEVGQAVGFGRSFGTNVAGGAGAATLGFAGGGAGNIGGFAGLLQQLQQVRNSERSLELQLRTLGLLEANLDAGIIDITQVDQFRQNIETERALLLQSRNALATTLDNFKTSTLGLPPDLPIDLDDEMIRKFQFMAPETIEVQNEADDLINAIGNLPAKPSRLELATILARMRNLIGRISERAQAVRKDLTELESASRSRVERMTARERKAFQEDKQKLGESLTDVLSRFDAAQQRLVTIAADQTSDTGQLTDRIVEVATAFSNVAQELALVQARARVESVSVEPIELAPEKAICIARANRLDWMNNRAALVDTWRLITFNANALKAGLDITFSGDLGTVGNNPLRFRGTNGSLQAGLRFDAPFTRLLERNNYRQVLIDYQQDRRRLIQYQDRVYQTLRLLLRQLEQLETNLEIQRRAVIIAVRRVDQTREILSKPPEPVEPGQPVAPLGPTAAQNLLSALSALRDAQNNFMSVWLNYYASRMLLMRDLGIMKIDDDGLWIDEPLIDVEGLDEQCCPLPPAVPGEWLREAGVAAPDQETPDADNVSLDEPLVLKSTQVFKQFATPKQKAPREARAQTGKSQKRVGPGASSSPTTARASEPGQLRSTLTTSPGQTLPRPTWSAERTAN